MIKISRELINSYADQIINQKSNPAEIMTDMEVENPELSYAIEAIGTSSLTAHEIPFGVAVSAGMCMMYAIIRAQIETDELNDILGD